MENSHENPFEHLQPLEPDEYGMRRDPSQQQSKQPSKKDDNTEEKS